MLAHDPLLARFQQARKDFSEEATLAPLNLDRIASLISLAGKRFTLVRYDAVDLPGLPARQLHAGHCTTKKSCLGSDLAMIAATGACYRSSPQAASPPSRIQT